MATDYRSDGKQAFRELLLALARHSHVRTYGTFWGTGIDSRLFAAAGFAVVAAEVVQAKHLGAVYDADTHGYRIHRGRAGKLTERFGMFHADFDGGPSPSNFREVRRLAAITDQWLAVTLSMDHQRDESMMGEAAFYTIPAWLTGATGFTLEYLGRYRRNRFGQTMWVAILQRREGKGTAHQVLPIQIAYSVGDRGYWASRPFYGLALLPHRYSPRNAHEKASDHSRYEAKRGSRVVACQECKRPFAQVHRNEKYCGLECRLQPRRRKSREWYWADPVAGRAYQAAYKRRCRSIMARPAEPSSLEVKAA